MKLFGLSLLALGLITQVTAEPTASVQSVTIVSRADNPLLSIQTTLESTTKAVTVDLQSVCMNS